jgi:hypothetical protein
MALESSRKQQILEKFKACMTSKETKDLFDAEVQSLSIEILKYAKRLAKKRRNSFTINEEDVTIASKIFKISSPYQWYYIPVSTNGSCLFTSIRVSMELSYILKQLAMGVAKQEFLLDGNHPEMLKAAEGVRQKVVEWYKRKPNEEVPCLGNFVEGEKSRPWKRSDIIALELTKRGKEVPEEGLLRENMILEYLFKMSQRPSWGSTPEYIAASCMAKKTIKIYQEKHYEDGSGDNRKLFIINSVNGSNKVCEKKGDDKKEIIEMEDDDGFEEQEYDDNEFDESYNLHFSPSNSHYQVLVSDRQYNALKTYYGIEAIKNIKPLF